jgi:hypothetical protein
VKRQAQENSKAWRAWQTYFDLGPERSLAKTARLLNHSKSMVKRWCRRFGWAARVQARETQLAEMQRRAIEAVAVERAVEWERLHEPTKRQAWEEAEANIAMVRKAREEWMAKGKLPGWEGMARMLELAFKLKRFAAGMPSEIKEVNANVKGKISVEWEEAIRKAFGLPEGAPVVDVEEVQKSPESGIRNAECGTAGTG